MNPGSPNGDFREFNAWAAANVHRQRQQGFSTAEVKITRGDLTPTQFRGLAQIMRDFTGGNARTTDEQNLLLRWVHRSAVMTLLEPTQRTHSWRMARGRSPMLWPAEARIAKLAITNSMGLARAVRNEGNNASGTLSLRSTSRREIVQWL
jgi:hypothetical protein